MQANAHAYSGRPAFFTGGETVAFDDLLARVDRLADGLRAGGLKPGDTVALLAFNTVDAFTLFGASAREGLVLFPLNWRLAPAELEGLLGLVRPQALFVDSANRPNLPPELPDSITLRVQLDGDAAEGWSDLHALAVPSTASVDAIDEHDPWLILSTAAVAGVPRAAELSHNNLSTAAEQLIARLGLMETDRHLCALPLYHITGLELSLAVFQAGGANVLLDRFDPAAAARLIEEHGVTLLASFPPLLTLLLDAAGEHGASLDSLRYVLGLDAPETIQRLLADTQAAFWTGYGQSETSGVVTLGDVLERPGSVGRALPGIEVSTFDDAGQPVPAGATGEIVVRGPLVFLGYRGDEDATRYAARFGWHHTGDLGRIDEEGYLYYMGRKPEKELIKSGGENIYPAEVEHAICQLPQVAAACVFGVPDETWGEAVKAVVELKSGQELDASAVIAAVASRIASYKKPRQVEFTSSLPREEGGGIDRAAVRAAYG